MRGLELIKAGPMMAEQAGTEFPDLARPEEWSMEPKLDGWRFFWIRTGAGVRSFAARNGNEHTGRPGLAEIETVLADVLELGDVVDGELLAPFDDRGSAAVSHLLAHGTGEGKLQAWLFDVLHRQGEELVREPYTARREVVDQLVPSGLTSPQDAAIVHVPHLEPREDLFDAFIAEGLEGIVLKHNGSIYVPGKHGKRWLKVKPQQSIEATITGFVPGKGRLVGKAGAFELEVLGSGVKTTCSTKDDDTRAEIEADEGRYLGKVAEIAHMGIMRSGKPRHPVFVRLRPDRDSAEYDHSRAKEDERNRATVETPPEPDTDLASMAGVSPVRSGSGRIRALKQMGDEKFAKTLADMDGYEEVDPKGYAAVQAELDRRAGR